jgi:hypothetical protein
MCPPALYLWSRLLLKVRPGTDEATLMLRLVTNFEDMGSFWWAPLHLLQTVVTFIWQPRFFNINTASGIIENSATDGTISSEDCRLDSFVHLIISCWFKLFWWRS